MANTLVLATELLQAEVIRTREKVLQVERFCNRAYEGELRQQGDTVKVPIIGAQTGYVNGTAGGTIVIDDMALSSDSMTVSQVYQNGKYTKDIEQIRQNFNLRSELARKMMYDMHFDHALHIWYQLTSNVPTSNQIGWGSTYSDAGSIVTETDSTIIDSLLGMKERVAAQDVRSGVVFFVNPAIITLIKSADQFDNTDRGNEMAIDGTPYNLIPGYSGTIDGSPIYSCNDLPQVDSNADSTANFTFMVAMQAGAVTFVDQMTKFAVREPSDAFRQNILLESVFQADVLSDTNKQALVAKKVANMTTGATGVRDYSAL